MIRQCRVSGVMVRSFGGFPKLWGLRPYSDPSIPAVFYGMYRPEDLRALREHRGFALVVWCGSDAMSVPRRPLFRLRPGIAHAATSRWHERDLRAAGLRYRRVNLVASDLSRFRCLPLGPEVYAYLPARRKSFFGWPVLSRAIGMLPKSLRVNIVPGVVHAPASMPARYAACFMGIRLTKHDGAAATVLELGAMGRRSIHNGDSPCVVRWTNAKSVADSIMAEFRHVGKTRPGVRDAVMEHVERRRDWLDPEWWTP